MPDTGYRMPDAGYRMPDVKPFTSELKPGTVVVEIDPRYYRPTEVDLLIGNPAKAKEKLSWSPQTTFKDLVKIMVAADWKLARQEVAMKEME